MREIFIVSLTTGDLYSIQLLRSDSLLLFYLWALQTGLCHSQASTGSCVCQEEFELSVVIVD